MKRFILLIVLLCMVLSGCGREENPYQVDTVIRIPVNPTEAATAAPTQYEETAAPTETEAPTEAAEPAETAEPTEGKTASGRKTSQPGKKPVSDAERSEKATESPATEPETQPPTEAPATEPSFDPSDYSLGSLEYEILDALNGCRAEAGLSELSMDARLSGIAALRAEECSVVWSTDRPDGSSYTTAMTDHAYGFGESAQCMGHLSGANGVESLAAKWTDPYVQSPVLSGDFTTIGIGICRSGGMTIAVVLLVG